MKNTILKIIFSLPMLVGSFAYAESFDEVLDVLEKEIISNQSTIIVGLLENEDSPLEDLLIQHLNDVDDSINDPVMFFTMQLEMLNFEVESPLFGVEEEDIFVFGNQIGSQFNHNKRIRNKIIHGKGTRWLLVIEALNDIASVDSSENAIKHFQYLKDQEVFSNCRLYKLKENNLLYQLKDVVVSKDDEKVVELPTRFQDDLVLIFGELRQRLILHDPLTLEEREEFKAKTRTEIGVELIKRLISSWSPEDVGSGCLIADEIGSSSSSTSSTSSVEFETSSSSSSYDTTTFFDSTETTSVVTSSTSSVTTTLSYQ